MSFSEVFEILRVRFRTAEGSYGIRVAQFLRRDEWVWLQLAHRDAAIEHGFLSVS